jgi:hypothetical protein
MFVTSSMPFRQRLNVIMTRWHRLFQAACNPYRPELHYMRGPGPKWYAAARGQQAFAQKSIAGEAGKLPSPPRRPAFSNC